MSALDDASFKLELAEAATVAKFARARMLAATRRAEGSEGTRDGRTLRAPSSLVELVAADNDARAATRALERRSKAA
jgi:hypothetical protein